MKVQQQIKRGIMVQDGRGSDAKRLQIQSLVQQDSGKASTFTS